MIWLTLILQGWFGKYVEEDNRQGREKKQGLLIDCYVNLGYRC